MPRIAYVNGRYLPHTEAGVYIEDRGFQFADGVYEVMTFYNRITVDDELHLIRLSRSLAELGIPEPMGRKALLTVIDETIRRNGHAHGYVYLQVTRGHTRRDHVYPKDVPPTLVITISRQKPVSAAEITKGTEIIVRPDIRWLRRDIKSVALLPNVILKNEASAAGKREVWLTDAEGFITEGSVSNAYIITQKGVLVTREEGNHLLSGIARHRILELARLAGITVEERAYTPQEVEDAAEAFLSASTSHMVPVVRVEGKKIGSGKPGPVFQRLFADYVGFIEQETGYRIWEA